MLRGFAIIAVVFIHNTPNGVSQVYFRPFMNFSVGLFLFLSGMLSNSNHINYIKRITKVVIPYIIWTLIYSILNNIKTPISIPGNYIYSLVTANAAAVMYYIFIYSELTLLIPLINKLANSKYKYIGFIISPIEIIMMRLLPLILGYKVNSYIETLMQISCVAWFTYYYLGYLLGNKIIKINYNIKSLFIVYLGTIVIQLLEGYWYLLMGEVNCGTQLKLSSLFSGAIFALLAYQLIFSEKIIHLTILKILGDCSFGIYFSHLALMKVLMSIPLYSEVITYPINAILVIIITLIFVLIGKRILGKYSKYLAL